MLLLSVLLFALGASAVPRINLGAGSVSAWQKTAEKILLIPRELYETWRAAE